MTSTFNDSPSADSDGSSAASNSPLEGVGRSAEGQSSFKVNSGGSSTGATTSPSGQKPALPFKHKATTAALKILAYYLLFSPLIAMPFYNTCIFHPYVTGAYDLTEVGGVKKEDVFFSSQGHRMHGWYFAKPEAKKLVIVSHGNAGNLTHRTGLIELLLKSGVSVFIYDYSGYGLSHGSPNIDGCIDDAVSAYDAIVKKTNFAPESIVLYGESLGTAISCQLAQKRPVSSIVLQSGFQSLPEIARQKIWAINLYPNFIFPCNQLDSRDFISKNNPKLLLIHGQKDEIIPAFNSDAMYAVDHGQKQIIRLANAGHNDVVEKMDSKSKKILSDFLN